MHIISICASRKSETGPAGKRSAVRQLGAVARSAMMRDVGPIEAFDLAVLELPFFEGLALSAYCDESLCRFHQAVMQADGILLQAPAYWRGPSGVVKNLFDLLGGGAYDSAADNATVVHGKRFALMIVGAQHGDADDAREILRKTLLCQGAQPLAACFAVDNPRLHDHEALIRGAWAFGTAAAREMQS